MDELLYKPSLTISDAKNLYYNVNNLSLDGGEGDRWAYAVVRGIRLRGFPSSRSRMEALRRHDLHHLINDCSTSQVDEALVAAWELGSGCQNFWVAWWLDLQAFGFGALFLAPKQCFKRFVLGRNSRNFFGEPLSESWSLRTVGELRAEMLPQNSIKLEANWTDRFLFFLYVILGLITLVVSIPIYAFFIIFGAIIGDGPKSRE